MTDDATYRRAVERGNELERECERLRADLRDTFAMAALAHEYSQTASDPDKAAEWAYSIADAMLAARKVKP